MSAFAKRIASCIAVAILAVVIGYFLDREGMLIVLGRNPYLYAGIMMAGAMGFAISALRILVFKVESWYALLEGMMLAAVIAALVIYQEGNQYWVIPGWCALLSAVVSAFLLYLDPRREHG